MKRWFVSIVFALVGLLLSLPPALAGGGTELLPILTTVAPYNSNENGSYLEVDVHLFRTYDKGELEVKFSWSEEGPVKTATATYSIDKPTTGKLRFIFDKPKPLISQYAAFWVDVTLNQNNQRTTGYTYGLAYRLNNNSSFSFGPRWDENISFGKREKDTWIAITIPVLMKGSSTSTEKPGILSSQIPELPTGWQGFGVPVYITGDSSVNNGQIGPISIVYYPTDLNTLAEYNFLHASSLSFSSTKLLQASWSRGNDYLEIDTAEGSGYYLGVKTSYRQTNPPLVTIKGEVTSAFDFTPLANAKIDLWASTESCNTIRLPRFETSTNEQGLWEISNQPAGWYLLDVSTRTEGTLQSCILVGDAPPIFKTKHPTHVLPYTTFTHSPGLYDNKAIVGQDVEVSLFYKTMGQTDLSSGGVIIVYDPVLLKYNGLSNRGLIDNVVEDLPGKIRVNFRNAAASDLESINVGTLKLKVLDPPIGSSMASRIWVEQSILSNGRQTYYSYSSTNYARVVYIKRSNGTPTVTPTPSPTPSPSPTPIATPVVSPAPALFFKAPKSVRHGEILEVELVLENYGQPVQSVEFQGTYDRSYLSLVSVKPTQKSVLSIESKSPGGFGFLFTKEGNEVFQRGKLAIMTFEVQKKALVGYTVISVNQNGFAIRGSPTYVQGSLFGVGFDVWYSQVIPPPATSPTLELIIPSKVMRHSVFNTRVWMDTAGMSGLSGGEVTLRFDPAVLEVVNAEASSGHLLLGKRLDNTSGTLYLAVGELMRDIWSGPLMNFDFRVKNPATAETTLRVTQSNITESVTWGLIPGSLQELHLGLSSSLVGDANGDDVVSILDFSLLAASFNRSSGDQGYDVRADFNRDGPVTILDFSFLAANFNKKGWEVTFLPQG